MEVLPAEDLAKLVGTMNELNRKVSELQEEIGKLRGWQRVDKVLSMRKAGPTSGSKSCTEIRERMEHWTCPGGVERLSVQEEFRNTMLPFVPYHKEITRRLVNGLLLDAGRIATNV